jgi:hypothetical protein
MTYNPTKFKDIKSPKAGTKMDGKVIEIKTGVLSDFVDSIIITSKWKADPQENAINVIMELESGDVIKKVMTVPESGNIKDKSSLGIWKKQFGDYPQVGQEIFAIADSDGWFRVPKL